MKPLRALRVYLLLGKQGQTTDDPAIRAWFAQSWRQEYPGRAGLDLIDQLDLHVAAMLDLDDNRSLLADLDQTTVDRARAALTQLPLDEQAYAIIMEGALTAGLTDWSLTGTVGNGATEVFATRDGSDLSTLIVPGLYTYEGFWGYFYDQLAVVGEQLSRDRWVLGETTGTDDIERRLQRLDRDLLERYRGNFIGAWNGVLNNLTLQSLVADKPQYAVLRRAAAASGSPLLELVREVDAETRLTREIEEAAAAITPEQANGGDLAGAIGEQLSQRMRSRSSGVQRILLDAAQRSGGGMVPGGATAEATPDTITTPIEAISRAFESWHMLAAGDAGQRPIDTLLGNLGAIWNNMQLAEQSPDQAAAALPTLLNSLTQYNSQLPEQVAAMVNRAESDFRSGASDASIEQMNRALTDRITFVCRDTITSSYPFASSSRSLSIDNFAGFFGPGGQMDSYFTEYLEPYVERTDGGLAWRADKELTARFSANTLRQFERAERIRRAFFAGGGTRPQVEITVAQVDAHPSVEQAALAINGEIVNTATGSLPRTVVWPGSGTATALELIPSLDRLAVTRFEGGPWTFIQFLQSANTRQQRGDTLRATFTVAGRNITYDFTINAIANPFLMPELGEFQCPQSID